MKDFFSKEEEKQEEAPVVKKPQRLATIVEMEEPLDVFPEEQS